MIENTECKRQARQLSVVDDRNGLETAFRRTHSREIHTETRAPVIFLKIAEMSSHHHDIGTPVLQTKKDTHADFMYSGIAHSVISVQTPRIVTLHALWMVFLICLTVICLLKANHAVETRVGETLIP